MINSLNAGQIPVKVDLGPLCAEEKATTDNEEFEEPRAPATSQSTLETLLAKSTPVTDPGRKRSIIRLPNLGRVQQESDEDDHSIQINFEHPPLDTLALLMSAMNQRRPLNQYAISASSTEIEASESSDPQQAELEWNENIGPNPTPPPLYFLPLKNNVLMSRDSLTEKRDNLVHLIAKNCELNTPILRLLSEIGAMDSRTRKAKK